MSLLKSNDARLHQKCSHYPVTHDMAQACEDCFKAYRDIGRGIAIALPQVGIMKSGFIMANAKKYFNCSYKPTANAKQFISKEGCLSDAKGGLREVPRYDEITATYVNQYGEHCEETFKQGYHDMCVVFQHETDHLNGITIF